MNPPTRPPVAAAARPLAAALLAALGCVESARQFTPSSPIDAAVDVAAPDRAAPADKSAEPGCDGAVCASRPRGCAVRETCGNGLDDDCDGTIDDPCACLPGTVEPCSLGAPGQSGVGQCRAGTHRCVGAGEFGRWGACEGGIGPTAERCDGLDNDCDGCADEGCCDAAAACPAPGDPRVPEGRPFAAYPLHGAEFFPGAVRAWRWSVRGGPCDAYLPHPTFALAGADAAEAVFTPRLSGDYAVTLAVTLADGAEARCEFVVHVGGPGLRVELCWDTNENVDLDLYLHAPANAEPWFSGSEGAIDALLLPTSCNSFNCAARVLPTVGRADWGFASSPLAECEGGPRGAEWRALGSCANPRLDIDNNNGVASRGLPENINVDRPRDAQRFRVMVENFSGGPARPMVNVYCGGRLRATVGAPPDVVADFTGEYGLVRLGTMWRALDVTVRVDAAGETTGCEVAPLHPPGAAAGYWITRGDPSY